MSPKQEDKLNKALEFVDWGQVVSNGGPPCFCFEDGEFCLRAERWVGHGTFHKFLPLSDLIESLQAASNAELERRRERVAGLEAALKEAFDYFMGPHACGDFTCNCGFCGLCEMRQRTEAALSGGTSALDAILAPWQAALRFANEELLNRGYDGSLRTPGAALDAAIAESTRELREERDALANLLSDALYELRNHDDHAYCEMGVQMEIPDIKDAEKHLAARDARVRAEGKREGMLESFKAIQDKLALAWRGGDNQKILTLAGALETLEKLAAQAGEVTNAD